MLTLGMQEVWQVVDGLILCILVAAVIALYRRPQKREMRIAQLETDQLDLLMRIQKLSGRVGRAAREEAEEEGSARTGKQSFAQQKGETSEQWKQRTRALLQRGVKP